MRSAYDAARMEANSSPVYAALLPDELVEMKRRAVDEYSGVAVHVSAAATATTTAMLATMVRHRRRRTIP